MFDDQGQSWSAVWACAIPMPWQSIQQKTDAAAGAHGDLPDVVA